MTMVMEQMPRVTSLVRVKKPSFITASSILTVQGFYYFATAVWPFVSIRSFQAVTGPKTDHLVTGNENDHWLVFTVAALILAISISLLSAGIRKSASVEALLLSVLSAGALAAIDFVFVIRGAIAPIYLGDLVLEILILGAWIYVYAEHRKDQDSVTERGAVRGVAGTPAEPRPIRQNPGSSHPVHSPGEGFIDGARKE